MNQLPSPVKTRTGEDTLALQNIIDENAKNLRDRLEALGHEPVVVEVVLFEGFREPILRATDINPRWSHLKAAFGNVLERWKAKDPAQGEVSPKVARTGTTGSPELVKG